MSEIRWCRQLLYTNGESRGVGPDGKAVRPGFSAEVVEKVMEEGGKLPFNEVLHAGRAFRGWFWVTGLVGAG